MITCNVFIPQFFWSKKMRTNIAVMFVISITTNIGMWFERFVIIVTSLHRDFLPSSWGYFRPTIVDISIYAGTLRSVLHLLPALHPLVADDRHLRGQGVLPAANPHAGHEHAAHAHDEDPDAHDSAVDAALQPAE